MQAEPSDLFRQLAPQPSGPPPVEAIVRRARRRRLTSFAVASCLAVPALIAGGLVLADRSRAPDPGLRPPAAVTRSDLLARPLQLPARGSGECPVTKPPQGFEGAGEGPVYLNTHRGRPYFDDPRANGMPWYPKGWQLAKTPLYGDPEYAGPILLRGGRIDGDGDIRFDIPSFVGDHLPKHLFYPAEERRGEEANLGRWFTVFNTAVDSAGCYAYQIDGAGFTEHIVFEARLR